MTLRCILAPAGFARHASRAGDRCRLGCCGRIPAPPTGRIPHMARRRIPRTGCRADRLRRRGRPRADRRSAPYRRLARGRARGRRDLRPPLCGRHRIRDTSFHPRGGAFPYSGRGRTRRRSARGGRGLVRQGDALQAGPPSRNRPAARPLRSNGSTSRRARSSAASAAANRSRCGWNCAKG